MTTPFRFYAARTARVIFVIALLAAVKPVFAFFSAPTNDALVTSASTAALSTFDSSATASVAAMASVDDVFPLDKQVPELHVTAALVQELGAAQPLFVYRSTARWPLASVTKLLTSVVALDELGAGTLVSVSDEAVQTEGEAGGLKRGDKYSVIDLVRTMLTVSSNDAAVALAQAYDKKMQSSELYEQALNKTALFTEAMQHKARAIGMSETYLGDPSGLSVVNQSIVTDLNALVNYIANNHPELFDITRAKEVKIIERKTMTSRKLVNINEFAGQSDFVGGKTGFIDQSEGNLISVFKYNGRKFVVIVLGTTDRFGQTRVLYEWLKTQVPNQ